MRIAQTGRYVKTKVWIVFYHLIATPYEKTTLLFDNVLLQNRSQI